MKVKQILNWSHVIVKQVLLFLKRTNIIVVYTFEH